MRKYAVLKNVARGINFGVVIKSDIDQRFYGWSDKGIEWSDWANQNAGSLENLPIGVSVGEFKSLSDELLQKLIANSDDVAAVDHGLIRDLSRQILVKSERFNNSSKFPSVTTRSIPLVTWNKKVSVQYKVKHFKQSIARSEISLKVRHNELAFNVQTRQFNTKPNRASRLIERHDIRTKMSKGSERIFGGQIVDAINKEILSNESMTLTKRGNVGSHTKEVVDFFVKGKLGYAIGRAGRGGLRSMTPNRGGNRGLRGSASRVIAGVLDPRKRRDVDGDGMIFDGTWREMPDPTKFKPEARNTGLGGLRSARNEVAKTRIVGKPARARVDLLDAFDAVQRVNDGDDFNSTFGDLWKAVKGRNDWGDLLADVAAKLSVEKLKSDGKNDKEIASSIKNIVDSSSSGLSKSKGHRYESSALGSLKDYVSRVATGKDADATDVIASFDDPYAPKGSKANALEAMVAFGLGKLETPQSRKKYEDSRGFKSRTGSVIDDILYASEGAAEPEMDDLLRKVKMGSTLKPSESRSLLNSLKDIKNNNDEFLGDERLENLINHVSEMSSIDTNSRERGLMSDTGKAPDKKLLSDTYEELIAYTGDVAFDYLEAVHGVDKEDYKYQRGDREYDGPQYPSYDLSRAIGESMSQDEQRNLIEAIRAYDDDPNTDRYAKSGPVYDAIKKAKRGGGLSSSTTGRNLTDYQDQYDFVVGKMFDKLPDRKERIQEYLDEGYDRELARETAIEKWLELEESENPELFMDEVNNRIEDLDRAKPGRTGLSSSTDAKPKGSMFPREKPLSEMSMEDLFNFTGYDTVGPAKPGYGYDGRYNPMIQNKIRDQRDKEIARRMMESVGKIDKPKSKKTRGLRSETGGDDLGSDMEDAIQAIVKLNRGEKLSLEEQRLVLQALKVIKRPDADIDEDERVGLIDMESRVRTGGVASRTGGKKRNLNETRSNDDAFPELSESERAEALRWYEEALSALPKNSPEAFQARLDAHQRLIEVMDSFFSDKYTRHNESYEEKYYRVAKQFGISPREVEKRINTVQNDRRGSSITGPEKSGVIDPERVRTKRPQKTEGLSSSTFESVKEMAEGANEDDFISMYKRFIDGETLNPADKSELAMSIGNILDNNPDINEDERVELIDLLGNIKKGERSGGMSSRSTRRPVEQNLTSRMATASTDRASRPRGLSSSTDTSATKTPVSKDGVKKPKRKSRLVIDITDSFGKKKGEGDGVLWESLTDEQKAQAQEALAERKEMIAKQLKTKIFKRWWQKATEEGSDKESLRAVRQRAKGTGGKYEVRPTDDPLTKDDIVDLLVTMDEQVSKGLLKQYKVDEKTNQIVLDKNGKPVMTETYANAARYLDDMMTILNMEEEDDFSLLEHLHTGSRQALHRKIGSAVTGKFKMGDSSVAGFAGGLQKATSVDELSDAELGKAKKLSIGKRLLRVNESRAAKARQRALRKTGNFRKGRILQSGDPELEMKRARLRARAGRRSMLSKFRRTIDADELSSDMSKVKGETSLIAIDNNGVVKISPRYVATLAKLDADLSRDRSSEENKSRVYDQLLADLWANSGFSGQPTLVTEDETRRLVAAGWQPVIRGTGSEEVNSESYVEQFLTDDSESRFIPGQGARAYGVGEYFAFPGSHWSGYRGSANQRHTILVLIPPSADIIGSRELSKEKNKMQELTAASIEALRGLGGREMAEALTPGELAKTLRDAMPSLPQEKSRSAQIMSQLVDRLDELEGMPASTESMQEKKNILNSIDYLFRFTKQKDDGYFAPLIGVDAIDVNGGTGTSSPLLLHNRAGVAAFQRPMTSEEAERLSKNEQGSSIGNVISTWTTMDDRRRVVSATPAPTGSRSKVGTKRRPSTRRPDPDGPTETTDPTPAVQTPTVQAPSAPTSAINTDAWTSSSPPSTGSNPATMLTDPNGTKYYAKLPKRGEPISTATERMETEVLAGKLYELAGIPVADLQMGANNGEPVMLSRMIQTRMPNGKGDNDKARDGFVVDAWLANWDAPLNDNIKVDNNGRPVRLDVGGSLDYRAQGAKKGSGGSTGFGPSVGEMTSMQKSGSSADFTNMDAGELKKQTQKLGTVTDDQIRKTVSAIVSDPARAKILADTLIARRDDIIKRYG